MRSMFRRASFALVAVLALGAMAASAASALTEFKPVPTKKKFTSTGGSFVLKWDPAEPTAITCTKSKDTGEIISGSTLGQLVITYTGCTSSVETPEETRSGCPIKSPGASSGEIIARALHGQLGAVAKTEAPSGAGVFLTEENKKPWLEFEENACVRYPAKITGSMVAEISVIGKSQLTNKFVFNKSIHKIKLDVGTEEEGELALFSMLVSVEGVNELTFEEALEVT
jgi:hypothetical protein